MISQQSICGNIQEEANDSLDLLTLETNVFIPQQMIQ
jgi:hypothetical protein